MNKHEKADRAKNYLQDEFFIGELDNLRNIQYDIIGNSGSANRDERESAYYMITAINNIKSHFESIAMNRKIDEKKFKIL
jgi:hypothetical protein|tara:strand:+ start:6163 stop:6402 length:240 start_codon:yes stop_codon:yes gene_type:complete